eukprot:COSAG02_NODE_4079_length_5822_cov_3.942862_3_plen_172_part_00
MRKKMTAWKKSLEKARSLPELPCAGLAALMVAAGTSRLSWTLRRSSPTPAFDLHLWPMIPKCAAAKSFAGKLLRKPRDGHESWEDWHACWEEFCKSITSESAMMLAVYALRERALLLGLQPTKGASTFSLPDTKPTPRPRANAAETMLPLTEDLPEAALVCQPYPLLSLRR